MGLGTSLSLAVSSSIRFLTSTPKPVINDFDVLLTQAGDAIITQSGLFISSLPTAIPQVLLEGFDVLLTQGEDAIITQSGLFVIRQDTDYDLITQDGVTLTLQDGRILQAGF